MKQLILTFATVMLLPVWLCAQTPPLQVGYSVYTVDPGSRIPVGAALFRVSDNTGAVVSEAGVGAAQPIVRGRIFVDEVGTKTGFAIVNPNPFAASIVFILIDSSGNELARRNYSLPANQHTHDYVSNLFPGQSAGVRGSLTFESSQPIAAVTVRENRNNRDEPLYTTLPVTNLAVAPSGDSIVFPHIAAGGGNTTELLLMNPTNVTISGRVDLFNSDGTPASVQNGNQTVSQIAYSITANGTFRAVLTAPALVSGWARAIPSPGNSAPAGSIVFQTKTNDQVVSEAGVAATRSTRTARIFVDNAQTQTGVAISNPSNVTANLTLTLMDRSGNVEETQTRTIAAGNHIGFYARDIFSTITDGFTGLMDIQSDIDVAPVTLKLTANTRGDLIITTLPVADLTNAPSATTLIFPQIAIGGVFSTRLILINTDNTAKASGRLSFYQSDSTNMVLPTGPETNSQFLYSLAANGGRQFYPGNSAHVAAVSVIDPASGLPSSEVIINEGNTLRPRLRITDTSGAFRDDFDAALQSLDPTVASITSTGAIKGEHAGFSTLTITAQNVITTVAAAVVHVDSGVTGFVVKGIAQDLANRLYLAASSEQAVLLAEDLKQSPVTYAGVRGSPGLKNGARLESQFRNPAYLALDQARGTLYVSDGSNHAIRRVTPGNDGGVQTLAGSGSAGSTDGPIAQALFNSPQGIVLDNRGNLWVADSGNHTIRRINLQTGVVQTIAGMPGATGLVDGSGAAARFNNPIGLAIQSETTAQQIARAQNGDPPPPIRMLVADSGNNVIRRVTEDGQVETITPINVNPGVAPDSNPSFLAASTPAVPLQFNAPTGVAIDSLGNIFVTETGSNQVKTILTTGTVITPAQKNTFSSPAGIAVTRDGVIIADGTSSARQIFFGGPSILSVTPDRITTKGGFAVIQGKNFGADSVVVVGGTRVSTVNVQSSTTISLTLPPLSSGVTTLSVQGRGGLSQVSLLVDGLALTELPAGAITTVAGGSNSLSDGSIATSAPLNGPAGVALDTAGNLFLADRNNRVRKVGAATGVITTIAGASDTGGLSGDGGPAAAALLNDPEGIAVDLAGNIFIADRENNRVRKIAAGTGIITTVAGNGRGGFSGDGGPAIQASLSSPIGIAVDAGGNLYIADYHASSASSYFESNRIRKVSAATGIITTVAGNGTSGSAGDGGPATAASLGFPKGITPDAAGNLYIADSDNKRVRKVAASTGIITTVAGNGQDGSFGDGGPATAAALGGLWGVAVDTAGNLFIVDGNNQVRKVTAATGIITTVVGIGRAGFSGDGGQATSALLNAPQGIAVDGAGNLFIADYLNKRVRKVAATNAIITTTAGIGDYDALGDGGPATAASLINPKGIAVDDAGNFFIADQGNYRVRKVAAGTRIITTIAGNGTSAFSGDGGPATSASLSSPLAVAVDSAANFFIADGYRIRKVAAATGVITTFAGNGNQGFSGDGGPATAASLSLGPFQSGITVDKAGNLYIADRANHRIRKVDAAGIITTVAGNGANGFSGDGGPARSASLSFPSGVKVDSTGNLYIADSSNYRIRKVDAQGTITTVAGNGRQGFSGDGGPAIAASLSYVDAVAIDAAGNLFISDEGNFEIRKVAASTGIITTVAGPGKPGNLGDGGPATAANFDSLEIALDSSGNLFLTDWIHNRVRVIRGPIP